MAQQHNTQSTDLGVRLVSACVLFPPVLAAAFFGSPYFETLIFIASAILLFELYGTSNGKIGWTIGGAIYIALAAHGLLALRSAAGQGTITIYWLFTLVWSADTFGYFIGRRLGGPKLAPKLSPKKTWIGFWGAVLGASVVGTFVAIYLGKTNVWPLVTFSATLGVVSQIGDLIESGFKRHFHKKDMGSLIPGHGGLFDRVDGLLAASIVCWLGQELSDKVLLEWL